MANKKIQEMTLLAEKLTSWSRVRGLSSDPYLSLLISSLQERKNLHVLADLDPMRYLPNLEPNMNSQRERLLRIITVIRNVLVFAPVALTWAAVNVATTAFSKYIAENSFSVTNFLDFWQNGYGYLADHWKIASVALLDFVIIMVVIILTVYISLLSQRIQTQYLADIKKAEDERAALALEIMLVLHDKKKITNVTMNQALAGSIARLVSATNNLDVAAKNIAKASRGK